MKWLWLLLKMIKFNVIVRIMCSVMYEVRSCGHRYWMLYEKWCCPLVICNRPLLHPIGISYKKFIYHQPYFEWYPGILFYKWFGNQIRNRLLNYNNTKWRTIRISQFFRATDKNSIGSESVTDDSITDKRPYRVPSTEVHKKKIMTGKMIE